MELSDLFFYAFLLGAGFLLFLIKRKPTHQNSEKNNGLTFRLLEFIAEFKSSIEAQVNEQQLVSDRHLPLDKEQRDAPTKAWSKLPQRESKPIPEKKTNIQEEIIPVSLNVQNENRLKNRHPFLKKKIQQAVIWSEILKPPIGLR